MTEQDAAQKRYDAQRDLLIDYIAEHHEMIIGNGNVLDEYVSHEVSADNEKITVRIKIRPKSLPGHPKAYPLTRQRVIKRSDLVAFHKGRTTIEKANVEDKPAIAHQVSWADQRASLSPPGGYSEFYLKEIQRLVKVNHVEPMRDAASRVYVDTLKCACVNMGTGPTMCEHLRFVYVTGWERESLLEGKNAAMILLPIGMGYVWLPVQLWQEVNPDTQKTSGTIALRDYNRKVANDSTSNHGALYSLAEEVSAYPDEAAVIKLGPGDSLIKAIRYVEEMIRSTDKYQVLSAMGGDDGDVRTKADTICSRKHNRPADRVMLSQFQAGIRFANPNRDNWLVACAFTAQVHSLCLPCHSATSGSNNVPKI